MGKKSFLLVAGCKKSSVISCKKPSQGFFNEKSLTRIKIEIAVLKIWHRETDEFKNIGPKIFDAILQKSGQLEINLPLSNEAP